LVPPDSGTARQDLSRDCFQAPRMVVATVSPLYFMSSEWIYNADQMVRSAHWATSTHAQFSHEIITYIPVLCTVPRIDACVLIF